MGQCAVCGERNARMLPRYREARLVRCARAANGQPSGDESVREAIEGSGMLRLAKRGANAVLGGLRADDTLKARFHR